jgi:hypothetical protein
MRSMIAVTVVSLLWALPAASARPLRDPGPCSDYIEQYCKNVSPGQGRIAACLRKNRASLSQECVAEGRKAKQVAESFWAACKGDVETLCNDVLAGHGRKVQCLKDHLRNTEGKKVSETCQGWLEERSARRAAHGKRG